MRFPTWGTRTSQAPILETDADGRLGICRTASGPSAVDRRSRKEACLLMGRLRTGSFHAVQRKTCHEFCAATIA